MQIDRSEEQKLFSYKDAFFVTIRIVEDNGVEFDFECWFKPKNENIILYKVVYIGEYWYPELNDEESKKFMEKHYDYILNECWESALEVL